MRFRRLFQTFQRSPRNSPPHLNSSRLPEFRLRPVATPTQVRRTFPMCPAFRQVVPFLEPLREDFLVRRPSYRPSFRRRNRLRLCYSERGSRPCGRFAETSDGLNHKRSALARSQKCPAIFQKQQGNLPFDPRLVGASQQRARNFMSKNFVQAGGICREQMLPT
jgi:hypothetical protein